MTIKSDVLAGLTPVLSNTYAVELPVKPTFPAIVFDIDTIPENRWVAGVEYEQHTVSIVILAKTLAEIATLLPQVRTAMLGVSVHLYEAEHGDAAYEDDASIYGYFTNHVIRTRQP